MKHAKKLASLILALVMVFALTATAFAMDGGSITIDNAVVGQTYSIYEILYLESYNKDSGAYSYKATADWSAFINGTDIKGVYVEVDAQGYVTWKASADAAAFAKLAQAYAKEHTITAKATQKATSATVKFENLELGYYLLDSTLGTLCSLDTTNPTVTIKEKNAEPTNEKTVEEDSSNTYGSVNDADIGQTVNFKSTITLYPGAENVTYHDTMSAGLTLNADSIKVYTDAALTTELNAGNSTVKTSGLTDGCTFELSFTQGYLNSLNAEATVYIFYSATLNANAVVGGDGNSNTSKLVYGDAAQTTTTPNSTTTTYTWSFDVLKYGNGDENKHLEGAQFVLLNKDKSKVATIVDGKLTGWADVPTAGTDGTITWPKNTVQTTDANGKIEIAGLDSDTYYLREIEAPAGYNKLAEDVKVEITAKTEDGKMTLAPVTAKINNQSGNELPSTGGIGTTIFYVVGSILLVGAAILLITKKRMSATK